MGGCELRGAIKRSGNASIKSKKKYHLLGQTWAKCGPRAICGPLAVPVRPAEVNCKLGIKRKTCTYYTAVQNVQKSSVDLNGPPQRSQVCNFFIFTAAEMNDRCHHHGIPQVVRSLNVTGINCNLKSASKMLLCNT